MTKLDSLRNEIDEATTAIWLTEPDEVRAMRLGIFPSEAGSEGQCFANMVFINGDMRALSAWITPAMILECLKDDTFTLKQCQKLFANINLVNVDLLAYLGFVKFASFARRIIELYPEMKTKDEFDTLLRSWYAYANRMYFWVHHMFPWGIGDAFPRIGGNDLQYMTKAHNSTAVADYFNKYSGKMAKLSNMDG